MSANGPRDSNHVDDEIDRQPEIPAISLRQIDFSHNPPLRRVRPGNDLMSPREALHRTRHSLCPGIWVPSTRVKADTLQKCPVSFYDLPADIHIAIAEQCKFGDLPNFCRVARRIHKSCVHLLYRDVDLSVHNRGIVTIQHDGEEKQIWSDNSACTIHNEVLAHKQIIFLETLIRLPEYGVHVHNLSWSLQLFQHDPKGRSRLATSWTEDPARTLLKIFGVFRNLTNLRHVDVAWLNEPHQIYAAPVSGTRPKSLFSSVTSICLVGAMARPLAVLILQSVSLANLQHLTFSNLQECGEPPRPFDPHQTLMLRVQSAKPAPKLPEAMLGLLKQLTGKCTSLRTLTLRKVAKAVVHSYDDTFFKKDVYVYEEWAEFIRSVAPTLRELTFEQGPPAFLHAPIDADTCRHHAVLWEGVQPAVASQIQAEQDLAKASGEWPTQSGGTFRAMDMLFSQTILR